MNREEKNKKLGRELIQQLEYLREKAEKDRILKEESCEL